MQSKYDYDWKLKDTVFTKDKGKVFSCFSCGGGSTMGYKLAGFDVIGCNEIDPKMMEAYILNHNPKYSYLESIETFKLRKDLPEELYNLDILDGSPPCSSFSMAGNREKDWGKEKKFREGQEVQVLDTLFFDFIDLAKELHPKIVVAENVKGMLLGNARDYILKIYQEFKEAGYQIGVMPHLLNARYMGVPQSRERVFFIAIRNDLADNFMQSIDMFQTAPYLDLDFKYKEILFKEIEDCGGRELSEFMKEIWENRKEGDSDFSCTNARFRNKPNTGFGQNYLYRNKVSGTITSKEDCQVLFSTPKYTSKTEVCKIGSYPGDYNFNGLKPHYLVGMSVPPVMMANIADRIYEQWLSKISNGTACSL